jgi:hypothetical protein
MYRFFWTREYVIFFSERELSLSSPTPTEYYVHNGRPPSELVHQQVIPKILSRQTSLSTLSVASPILMRGSRVFITYKHNFPFITPRHTCTHLFFFLHILKSQFTICLKSEFLYLDRIGMDNDLQNNSDLERELEIRRIQVN